ncbi:CotS family spore coat protein [uncultured Clostridium sp.]|uniref:CotS family spore coat protein n=1 Tax=uncultured Clostridium sp. TaxID=59620 RepID=UPI0025F29EB2|nr:CotS family spore coat protein [uncultured Clostridium sp.]
MNKIRYSEREYLCDYDLSLDFFNAVGVKVKDIIPLRKVFLLSTDEGNKILKRVNYNVERIKFISESLEYLKKSYKNIISYNKLKNNLNYIKWKDGIYIVMDILNGREASFSNPVEIELCAENIALMHNAAEGITGYLRGKYKKDFRDQSFKQKLKKAVEDFEYIKTVVNKYENKNEFDKLFLNNADKYIEEIKNTERDIDESSYESLRSDNNNIVVCHNDLAYHNFLIKNSEVSIIDFDYMTLDLRVCDVADFLLKAVKNSAFDIDKALSAMNSYEKVNTLKKEEKELIYIFLKFPKDIYSIITDYYFKRKKWTYDVYLSRLSAKLNNELFREEFINNYKNLII